MPRVLLVDDTPQIAELLTFALQDRGYDVVTTGYTCTINEVIAEKQIDALVFDCSAYEMSEALFDAVRDHPGHVEIPIVIISDTPEQADASLRVRAARRVLLVPKPFMGSQVALALDQLLG